MRNVLLTLLCTLGLVACGGRSDDPATVASDLNKLQGTWAFESIEAAGQKLPMEPFQGTTVTWEGDRYDVKQGDLVVESASAQIDPSKSPKTLDSTVLDGPNKGAVYLGIYEVSGDLLTVCFDPEGKQRPTEFKAESGSHTLVVHRRVKT